MRLLREAEGQGPDAYAGTETVHDGKADTGKGAGNPPER